jgi:tRNA G46 methylase TrmB
MQIVKRQATTIYKKPILAHQIEVFNLVKKFINQRAQPIILDSGCGTGLSTTLLAEQYPDHSIIGFDKSIARLSRLRQKIPDNCSLYRADLIDIWRLIAEQNWPIAKHFIFFPNPWPKASQIKRRFHAHPVFATMAALAPELELRTNWKIYADEFKIALEILGHKAQVLTKSDHSFMTLFEKKYLEHQCPIFILKSSRSTQDINY